MEVYSRETFRDYRKIDGYDNYVISNYGEVFNTTSGRMLKNSIRQGYYGVSLCKNGERKSHIIHRLVAIHFIDNPENKTCVDHIDNDKLNNHISNLRYATISENAFNTGVNVVNTSGYKGVWFNKNRNKWYAEIKYKKKKIHLGCFSTKEQAITARREKAKELFKEYTNDCEKDDN
jgi:hypothetical protein